METLKVFVENLEPRTFCQEWLPLIIAVVAVCISLYSAYLARKDLIAAHRPYVYVTDRSDSKGAMDVHSVMVCCCNAPAKITKEEFYYEVVEIKDDNEKTIADPILWHKTCPEHTVYPSEKTSNQVYDRNRLTDLLAAYPNATIKRRAEIDYKELSTDSNKKYHFKGSWHYDRGLNVWGTDNMDGN